MRRLQLRTRGFPFRAVVLLALLGLVWVGCNDISDRLSGPSPSKVSDSNGLSADNARVQEVMAVQNRHTDELLRNPDVVGTGTGIGANGEPVVLILARRPGVAGLPTEIEGVRTRVDVIGEVTAFRSFKGTYRPVPAGVSVGNDNECAAGTIGCMVIKGGVHHMLSCNHVFARVNAASIGERIDQPGRYDAKPICSSSGQAGTLSGFVTISFAPNANNVVDCATAQLTSSDDCSMVSNLYTPSGTVVSPSVGLAVKKVGRTSGLTHGTISGINVTVNVNYGSPGVARFVNQIYVASTFIKSGDSGSLMVTETGENPVGLCFAGGSGSSFANPIGPVLQQLGVSICSQ